MVNESYRPGGADPARPAGPWESLTGLSFPWGRRAIALRVAAVTFAWPTFQALLRGGAVDAVAMAAAAVVLFKAARLIDDGFTNGAAARPLRVGGLSLPPRRAGALLTGLAAFLISLAGAHDSHVMALVFGALGFAGCALAYGLEAGQERPARPRERPRPSSFRAARGAAARPDPVREMLAEARRKIADIEDAAAALHARELKTRLERIVARARRVLSLVEREPGDLVRAQRFFATYLDGTREVVSRYAARQRDLADTPLAENFRRVLSTVEEVFAEQEDVLLRDERQDLEVKIEVLETQMRREGVR